MEMSSVLVVGSIALDTIENPNGKRENLLGGSATYVTVAAGRSIPVHVAGIIGDDFPAEGLEVFRQYSDDLSDLKQVSGKTFRWGGKYSEDMDTRETLFTELGVFSEYSPQISHTNKTVPIVFLANIHPALQLSIIEQMEGNPLIITDTMNLWIETTKNELLDVLNKTNILLINEGEAELLSGTNDIEKSAVKLQELGPKTVVIKKGSSGAILFSGGEKISIGVYPVRKVIDTTGAGDAFGGGFISALASGGSFQDALINGSVLGSICVEGFGIESLKKVNSGELLKREKFLRTCFFS